jgi:hypothetical protein
MISLKILHLLRLHFSRNETHHAMLYISATALVTSWHGALHFSVQETKKINKIKTSLRHYDLHCTINDS